MQHLYYYYSEDRYWNWLWDWFWKSCYVAMSKQALGRNCYSFPEIGRVGMGWEEVVMNLWRQQYPQPHQPGRCQVETRWQIFHHKRRSPEGGYILSQGVHMSRANTLVVRRAVSLSWALIVCSASTVMTYNPGHSRCIPSECHSLEHVSVTYCMTNHYKA